MQALHANDATQILLAITERYTINSHAKKRAPAGGGLLKVF
jgi:hypothetical protein